MINGWQTVSIGEVAKPIERPEVPLAGTTYRQIGVRLWGQGAYERESIDGSQTRYSTLSRVESGDIIVNKIWARNGSVAIVSDKLSGCFGSGEFPTFAPDRKRLEPRWFHWMTKTKWLWQACDEKSQGTSGKNRIRPEKFLEIEIPLPSLDEQHYIVERIEALAARIAKAQSLREEAKTEVEYYKASILNSAFVGKLIPNEAILNHNFESSWALLEKILAERKELTKNGKEDILSLPNPDLLPKLPQSWIWVTIDHICSRVTDGFHDTPKPTEKGVPFVLATHVKSDGIDFKNCLYVSETDHQVLYAKTQVKKGDILVVNIGAGSGTPVIVNVDFEFSFKNVAILKRLSLIDEKYMFFYLLAKRVELFREISKGGAQPFLSLKSLRTIPFPLAPLAEQKRIVAHLETLFAQIDKVTQLQVKTQKELDALMPSILNKAFNGEL